MGTSALKSSMSSKKHSNAAAQSSRGSASKGQMQLTSYLWKKLECNGKTVEKLWNFFSWDLYEPCKICKSIPTTLIIGLKRFVTSNYSVFFPFTGWHMGFRNFPKTQNLPYLQKIISLKVTKINQQLFL